MSPELFIFIVIVLGFITLVINVIIFIMSITALYRFNKYFPLLAESNNKIAIRLKKILKDQGESEIDE